MNPDTLMNNYSSTHLFYNTFLLKSQTRQYTLPVIINFNGQVAFHKKIDVIKKGKNRKFGVRYVAVMCIKYIPSFSLTKATFLCWQNVLKTCNLSISQKRKIPTTTKTV